MERITLAPAGAAGGAAEAGAEGAPDADGGSAALACSARLLASLQRRPVSAAGGGKAPGLRALGAALRGVGKGGQRGGKGRGGGKGPPPPEGGEGGTSRGGGGGRGGPVSYTHLTLPT
eukprot:4513460-Prymnesium_polylepis.1